MAGSREAFPDYEASIKVFKATLPDPDGRRKICQGSSCSARKSAPEKRGGSCCRMKMTGVGGSQEPKWSN